MPSSTPVGLIGIGLMGEVYARRLIAAGFSVIGFDIDPAKGERLEAIGGRAGSLTDIAQKCEPIVLAVFNTDQVEDVVERALFRPRLARSCSAPRPATPTVSRRSARASARRLRFLETPVSGTSEQVRQGDGVGLIGGDAAIARRRRARARCAVSAALSHRQGRRRRPRQARGQSHPGAQPAGAGRRSGVRLPPRPRSGGFPQGGAGFGRGLAGDGHQGAENDRRRFLAGGPREADAQGRCI